MQEAICRLPRVSIVRCSCLGGTHISHVSVCTADLADQLSSSFGMIRTTQSYQVLLLLRSICDQAGLSEKPRKDRLGTCKDETRLFSREEDASTSNGRSHAHNVGEGFHFQQDGVRPDSARGLRKFARNFCLWQVDAIVMSSPPRGNHFPRHDRCCSSMG